jgi:AcrR family transcriptional regulator
MGTTTSSGAERRRAPARRGHGAALRDDILVAASSMIARSGDASTLTLRAVAREVGVAATSIYLHFGSVEDLLAAVKDCRFAELAGLLTEAADEAGADATARVRARAHAYVRFGGDRPGEYAVMFASRLTPPGGAATRPAYAAEIFAELVGDIMGIRRRGRPPMDASEASMVCFHLWTALHGMVSLRLLRPLMDWPPVDAEVDDLVSRLLR